MTNPAVSKSLTRSGPLELSAQGAFGGVAVVDRVLYIAHQVRQAHLVVFTAQPICAA